ncbi:BA14K family protein [Rhodoplanes roseus]|uniref:Lectin-like protein BA14k n=1 Tax=Rhodoplanes roseus TaxID=29409 RepID=A0A327KPP4_9BRAD|nr:BA14K family protein [Rhodoplanes roseus]RAI40819.1 hypothetical protein CH341_23005 [Rhodoplanes roseus]
MISKMKLASGAVAVAAMLTMAVPQAEAQRWGHRGYHGGWGGGGGAAAAGIAGFATGAIIGGALASQPSYGYGYGPGYGPAPVYGGGPAYGGGGDAVAYCQQRFRSYDPASGTYMGYDGQRHSCP